MNYDAVPNELKSAPQWVTWRYEKEGTPASKDVEGATKIPYNARTGHKASSTNEHTWSPYVAAVQAAASRKHDGIGYVFSEHDPYTGIDLDDCIDPAGSMAAWAREIVTTMDSYTEISPSGSGVKIWVEGEIPSSLKTPHIEMYFKARYFTVTGQHLRDTPTTIRNVNGALTQLYETVKKEVPTPAPGPTPRATIGNEHATEWAHKKLAEAIRMVTLAPDGIKHDTLIDAGRLAGGVVPHISELEIETALFAAIEGRAADKQAARKTIRDGIRMGIAAPLPVPPPPPQPVFDADNVACCPVHQRRLDPARNGNGYKCHTRDNSTASGWCDFWWKGNGYVIPQAAAEPVIIAGEIITQAPLAGASTAPRYQLYKLSGLRALPPVEWLIEGEIPAALTTIICGPSGAGKSFLMIDYAMRVARRYPDRIVVYIAPEGGSGYNMRTQAWLEHFGGGEPDNLLFILQAIPLLTPQAVSDLIAIIRPFKPIMLIVDTLARCLVGGDENSAKDVGMFFYHTDMIRQETGAAISIVHHTGKSGGGYRGSSVLYGSVESWIDVANDDGLITVSCGKSKDAKPFPPRYLRMVEVGESVVLLPADQVNTRDAGLTDPQRKILETLALDIFTGPGAKRSELVSATGMPEPTMYKILSRLKRSGSISQGKRGDPYFITDSGMAVIRSYHRDLRLQREKLSNYPETITELSDSSSPTIKLSPPLYKGEIDSRESDSSESELLEDDTQSTENTIGAKSDQPSAPKDAPRLDWEYLRRMKAVGDDAAIRRHCVINRQDYDMVLEQLQSGRGA